MKIARRIKKRRMKKYELLPFNKDGIKFNKILFLKLML